MTMTTTDKQNLAALSFSGYARGVRFSCGPARYAKGKMSLDWTKDDKDGFKGPADRLAEALNARWSHRCGYLFTPSRAVLWHVLFVGGWDAGMDWRGVYGNTQAPLFHSPDKRSMTLREAAREVEALCASLVVAK